MQDLTINQNSFLNYLKQKGFSNIRRIQHDLELKSPNSVVKTLKALVQKGYVEKQPDHKCESCGVVKTKYVLKKI